MRLKKRLEPLVFVGPYTYNSVQNFKTLGQPLPGEKYVAEKRRKKIIPNIVLHLNDPFCFSLTCPELSWRGPGHYTQMLMGGSLEGGLW